MSEIPINKAFLAIRNAFGWSQVRLGLEIGISERMIKFYESGQTAPTVKVLNRIREKLGLDLYMIAYCCGMDVSMLPANIQAAIKNLEVAVNEHLDLIAQDKRRLPMGFW